MNKTTFKIARGAETLGDYTAEQIREFLKNGSLVVTDFFWNEAVSEWRPLSEWVKGKLSDRLRVWFKGIAGQQNQVRFIAIAVALLLASWIYPPWEHYDPHAKDSSAEHPHGWYCVFDTNQGEANANSLVMRIDFGRLFLLDAIIIAGTGAMAWVGARWRLNSLAVGGSLIAVFLIFAIGGIGWPALQTRLAKDHKQAKWDASRVDPSDLKSIILFDSTFDIIYFKGRIKNELPQPICSVECKLSFYDRRRTLLEVRHEIIGKSGPESDSSLCFHPGEPASFSSDVYLKKQLPDGFSWDVEITGAHYEQ